MNSIELKGKPMSGLRRRDGTPIPRGEIEALPVGTLYWTITSSMGLLREGWDGNNKDARLLRTGNVFLSMSTALEAAAAVRRLLKGGYSTRRKETTISIEEVTK